MKKTIYSLIDNKKITLFFVVMIIAAGIFSFIESPKQESPDFSIPYAMITTVYPGASQTDVDTYVTKPIVNVINQIEGCESTKSYSSNSFSLIIMELDFNTDVDGAFSQLNKEVLSLQTELPEDCLKINVNTDITSTPGVLISLSSDELSNTEASDIAEQIGSELKVIEGIESYEVMGNLSDEVIIRVDENKMMDAGLTLSQISEIVSLGSKDIPIGKVIGEDGVGVIDYNGSYSDIEDVMNLAIGYHPVQNQVIYLKNIADITMETSASNTYYRHNAKNAVIIAAYFKEGINILPLEKKINEKLDDFKKELPDDSETALIISQPAEIDESLNNFSRNLLIAVGLVILVVLIGMGFRNAMVVSVSLPLSILVSFGVMYLLDIRIHQISIAALILSLGMLVDNSIVVSDAIQGYLDDGINKRKACMKGVRSVAGPVLTSTLTTIAAFVPFLFLNSIAGDYIKALPQIVAISLAASYLTAIFIVPVLGFILFKKKKRSNKQKARGVFFIKLLKGGMKRKGLVILIVMLLIAGTVFIAMELDTVFFPASDKNIVYVDIRNNAAGDLKGTIELVDEIEAVIKNEKEVIEYTSAAGSGLPRFNKIMYIYTKTPDIGQIMMRLDLDDSDYKTNEEYKEYMQDKLDTMKLDAKITVKQLMYAFPMDEDLKIRITGDDLDLLKVYETQVYEMLMSKEGILNVNKENSEYVTEYELTMNDEKISRLGLLNTQVLNEISIAGLGRKSAVIMTDGAEIPVIVKSGNPEQIYVKSAAGNYVSSKELTEITAVKRLSTIPGFNGSYAMTITADYDLEDDKKELLKEVKDNIGDMDFENASVIYEGEDELIKENFGQVGILGLIALAVVFIILLIQFKSFTMPLLIFITIPLSAVGSAAGLYITGQPVSFTALLGIVSLLGIVVNNAIILIDYINREKGTGVSTKKACINASRRRLRPILLGTITTVIGLIPLAIGTSQLFKPMAIALMSGLLVSTLLTLVVLPVFVSIVYKKR